MYLITADRKLAILTTEGWKRVFLIDGSGRLAIAVHGRDDANFRILPADRALEPVSIEEFAHRHREFAGFVLRFEIQPPGVPSGTWLLADLTAYSREISQEPVVWRKVVTRHTRFRFTLRTDGGKPREIDPGR